jgi:HEAT repeat protein
MDQARGPDTKVAVAAMDGLSLVADPEAFATLAELTAAKDPTTKRYAQEALGRSPLGDGQLAAIIADKGRPEAQQAAAWMLGLSGSQVAAPALLGAIKSKDAGLRCTAATALGRVGGARAFDPLVVMANRDPAPECRQAALAALEDMSETGSDMPPLETQTKGLTTLVPTERAATAKALGARGDRRAVSFLISALAFETDPRVQQAIVEALGELKDLAATPFLVIVLEQARGQVAYSTLAAMATIRDPRGADAASRVLARSSDPRTRRLAVRALGWMNAGGPRIAAALKDPSVEVRLEALSVLADSRAPGAEAALLDALSDSEIAVRDQSARLLGAWEVTNAAPALIKLISDPAPAVRISAIQALGRVGKKPAADALNGFIKTESKKKAARRNTYLIQEASQALSKIEGRLAGGTP